MRAVITDKDDTSGRWLYAWEQVAADYTSGADIDPGAKRTGALDNSPAVEINDAEVDVGTVVHLRERGYVGGQMWWEFSHPAGGAGGDPSVYYASYTPGSYSSLVRASLNGPVQVPPGIYLVTAVVGIFWISSTGSARHGLVAWDSAGSVPTTADLYSESISANSVTATQSRTIILQDVIDTADLAPATLYNIDAFYRIESGTVGGFQTYRITAMPLSAATAT